MWNLPGPEFKLMSPALEDRFLTTGLPGKSSQAVVKCNKCVSALGTVLSLLIEPKIHTGTSVSASCSASFCREHKKGRKMLTFHCIDASVIESQVSECVTHVLFLPAGRPTECVMFLNKISLV